MTEQPKKVMILSGIPACGKSSYAEIATAGVPGDVFSADDHHPKGPYDPRNLQGAHRACYKAFIAALQAFNATLLIVDNTNLSAAEIAPYYLAAESFGYVPTILRFHLSLPVAIVRNRKRRKEVPDTYIFKKHAQFLTRDVLPWWSVEEIFSPFSEVEASRARELEMNTYEYRSES